MWLRPHNQGRVERGGVTYTPPPLQTFFEICRYLTKYVGKISWPNVVSKFVEFYIKSEMQNSDKIQPRRNQTFTGDDGF